MNTVIVQGRDSGLGRRIEERLSQDPGVAAVVDGPLGLIGGSNGLDVVVLAPSGGPERDGSGGGGVDLVGASELLDQLEGTEVESLVVVSSAMVYGAWADNAMPLTEDAPLRPNPGSVYAQDKAELERLAGEFGRRHPRTTVAVLRPTVTTSGEPDALDWLGRSLWHVATARHGEADPPAQFLHIDDLVSAVELARRQRLAGAYNVAPEGWLTAARQVELVGRGGRLRIPAGIVDRVVALRWLLGLTSTPPEVLPYVMHPWVVASDRLRACGWEPVSNHEEAFVVGSRAGWWASLSARRRQELSLGALVMTVAGAVTATVAVIRRARAGALRRGR
jgi:nucleoside-diphosphate-sugar epimerase